MQIKFFHTSAAFALLSLSLPVLAMEESSYEEYAQRREAAGLPKILIVGCGHGAKYGHAHADCWTVNVEKDPRPIVPQTTEKFKESVQYDAILDITTGHWPAGKYNPENSVRDTLSDKSKSGQNLRKYKDEFDVVVLEQPYPESLNRPWTLWNSLHMVKVGGELLIESCQGYGSSLYEVRDDNKFMACFTPAEVVPYGENFNPENIAKKLAAFGANSPYQKRENIDMTPLARFLAQRGLTDIVNIEQGFQPYTAEEEGNLQTARQNHILSATKTQETEDELENWGHILQKNAKALFPLHIKK